MSEQNQTVDSDLPEVTAEQMLDSLKTKADLMGVKYHPSISYEKLLIKVREAQSAPAGEVGVAEEEQTSVVQTKETEVEKRKRLKAEALKLVRVNISNMNPFKRDIESEIVSAGNKYVGTIKRCIPFNTPDGWHIEQILLNTLKERKCQLFVDVKGPQGQTIRTGKLVPEFAIEILPPLTPQELKELARRQAIARVED